MTLQDQIAALPPMPDAGDAGLSNDEFMFRKLWALRARLDLACEVIRTRVQIRSDSDCDDIMRLLSEMGANRD